MNTPPKVGPGLAALARDLLSLRTQCRRNLAAARFVIAHATTGADRAIGELAARDGARMMEQVDALLPLVAALAAATPEEDT